MGDEPCRLPTFWAHDAASPSHYVPWLGLGVVAIPAMENCRVRLVSTCGMLCLFFNMISGGVVPWLEGLVLFELGLFRRIRIR